MTAGFEVELDPGVHPRRDCLRAALCAALATQDRAADGGAARTGRKARGRGRRRTVGIGLRLEPGAARLAGGTAGRGRLSGGRRLGAAGRHGGVPCLARRRGAVAPDARGVRQTLRRAAELLREGKDWAVSGVLEHRVEGKHSLPRTQLWQEIGIESSRDADGDDLASRASRPAARRSGMAWAAGCGRSRWCGPSSSTWRFAGAAAAGSTGWRKSTTAGACSMRRAPKSRAGSGGARDRLRHARTARAQRARVAAAQSAARTDQLGAIDDLPQSVRALLPQVPVNGHGCFVSGTPGPDGREAWIAGSTFERAVSEALLKPEDQLATATS